MKMIDKIVDMVINELENGKVPVWRKTWKDFMPMNAFSQRSYRGFNTLLLSYCCEEHKFPYPLFGTYKQISEAGGRVKKGEKAILIVFWKVNEETKYVKTIDREVCVNKRFIPF